jgi:hypothetical protein
VDQPYQGDQVRALRSEPALRVLLHDGDHQRRIAARLGVANSRLQDGRSGESGVDVLLCQSGEGIMPYDRGPRSGKAFAGEVAQQFMEAVPDQSSGIDSDDFDELRVNQFL